MSTTHLLSQTPVLLLAGGLGTRLRPVLSDRPKALAPVAGRPFLELQIELLHAQGARHFVLCTGHLAEQVRDQLGDGSRFGVRIDHSEEPTPRGTAGALRLAQHFFQPRALVLNGDTFLDVDYEELLRHHQCQQDIMATLALAQLDETSRYGSVRLDPSGRVVAFQEKSAAGGWLNAGAYVIEASLIKRIATDRPVSLEHEVFPAALSDGLGLAGWTCAAAFHDIGTPEALMRFSAVYERIRHARRAG